MSVHHENHANLGHMDLREKWIYDRHSCVKLNTHSSLLFFQFWNQFSMPYFNLIPRPIQILNGPGNKDNHTCVRKWRSSHLCIDNYNQHFHLLLSGGLDATTPIAIHSATPIVQNTAALTINEYVKHLFPHVILPTRGINEQICSWELHLLMHKVSLVWRRMSQHVHCCH